MDNTMNTFNHYPQSRIRRQQFSAIHSNSEFHQFKKPRFSETTRNQNPSIPLSINRSKLAIPFKSQVCLRFQKGRCYYGENCHYAHDISEIRNPSFTGVDTVANNSHLIKRNVVGKMTTCNWFFNGKVCPYGDKCQFLHKCDQNVMREGCFNKESFAISVLNGENDLSGSDHIECKSLNAGEVCERVIFHKMKLCNAWEKFGNCPYGMKCIFVHGKAELQELSSLAALEYGYAFKLKLPASHSNIVASSEIGIKTASKMQLKGNRCFMKWNVNKISRIYADWMDCMDSLPMALSEIGT